MLIYLDNCSFNRPFDDQKQVRIRIETEAKLYIQENIVSGVFLLAWSYILEYENSFNPFQERKETISNWKKYSVFDTDETTEIIEIAKVLEMQGIKAKDALHVACAVCMKCSYFITTDMILIKKLRNFELLRVVNPIDFINQLEENQC
jgi:predicted nucleic acid-binding protein